MLVVDLAPIAPLTDREGTTHKSHNRPIILEVEVELWKLIS
jgi:hypothetical protein